MTRVVVPRGSTGTSSSSSSRSSLPGSSSVPSPLHLPSGISIHSPPKEEELADGVAQMNINGSQVEHDVGGDTKAAECNTPCQGCVSSDATHGTHEETGSDVVGETELMWQSNESTVVERDELSGVDFGQISGAASLPPPPPVPPPTPSAANSSPRRFNAGVPTATQSGLSRRSSAWPVRSSLSDPLPSSPQFHVDNEGYNSSDEQNPCFGSYDNDEIERQFELDIRRIKGLEVRRMLEDGNCLFRAIADQVYGDSQLYDLVRQMCIDYMEREQDHFSQFVTEGFTSYCKRKRRDKVYGNNVEIQACSEMYNRPIHIYSYSTEPINIFHGSYGTDTPPIRLSYHHSNHYNSLVDPRRLAVGAGLGFSSLRGRNIDKEHVKAAMKAQQDQQIENALLAEGRFYSDLELTEKEIEASIMEASRIEYLAGNKFKQQASPGCTSGSKPSSSGSGSSVRKVGASDSGLSSSMQMVLSMGFSYLQVIEAYSIFGDDVDSMVCYLLETSNRKGKAAE